MKTPTAKSRRASRVRHSLVSIRGTAKARLSVYRSNAHIWSQIIDDQNHRTLASASDLKLKGTKTERAQSVGTQVAKAAISAGIKTVVFDRGSYRYHGRVKALAEAARSAGLQF